MSSPRGAAQGGAASSCCGTEVTLSEEARSLERRRGRDTGGLMSADALEPAGSTSIPAVLAHTAERAGDELAVADGDVRLTYAELRDEARTFGAGLAAVGVEPGDRVANCAHTSGSGTIAGLGPLPPGPVLGSLTTPIHGHRRSGERRGGEGGTMLRSANRGHPGRAPPRV